MNAAAYWVTEGVPARAADHVNESDMAVQRTAATLLASVAGHVASPPPGAGDRLAVLARVEAGAVEAVAAAVREAVAGLYPGAQVKGAVGEIAADVGWVRVTIPTRGPDA